MNELEMKIKRLTKRIEDFEKDIGDLKVDLRLVKSEKAKEMLSDEIKKLENYKERKEFELWKLTK